MPAHYPTWTAGTPHTDPDASPRKCRKVKDVAVIEVENATYRGCGPIEGFFEMVNPHTDPRRLWGALRAEVYCAWHGEKPPTTYPQIIVGKNFKIHLRYTGMVIDNLA